MRISSKNGAKSVKNKSFDNQSVISSDYVFLKNGNVKRKRNKNSYFETFLEKRRMAAEFAQSKRCYSTISTKIQHLNKNNNNSNNIKQNNKLFYHGMQEIINMNNLKHNLPGKATPIIDNTDNLLKIEEEKIIAECENNNNNLNNYFSENNINIINKNKINNDLSQPYFDDIIHLTNKSNVNNDENNFIPPYELENDTNEETSKFGNEGRIIDTNKSRKIEMIPEKHFDIINRDKYNKLKNSVNTYIKKRPIRDENNQMSTLMQNKNYKVNSNDSNPVNISISFRNDFNKNNSNNNTNKTNNVGNKNKKENNKNINENIITNEFNIKYNENKNNDMDRYVETNNNEENNNNSLDFFKDNNKINVNQNNYINENINIDNINNKNNNANNTINTQNEVSNDIIEETNIIKVNEDNSNERENQIKTDNNIQNKLNIYINDNNLNPPFKTIEETNKSIKFNKIKIQNKEQNNSNRTIEISNRQKENKNLKNTNKQTNANANTSKNIEKFYENNNFQIYNTNNNIENNSNIPINKKKNVEKNKNQNYYSLMINKDIERLNKLKQSSQRNNNQNYFNEINDFIDNIKKKRENKNDEYINMTNENKEKLKEIQNQKKNLQLFQSQINTALNYNKNKISFQSTKYFNNHQNNLNTSNNNNNKKIRNDYKVKISTRMQNLLLKLEKEKLSNNIEKYETSIDDMNNNEDENNKRIFTQNVINSINNFIETENSGIISNNQINHINNINNNNHNNNFILLQNYYNNENNYINSRKNKNPKRNYYNYVSFDDINKINIKNNISERNKQNLKNNNIEFDKNDIKTLDEKIYKLIRTKNVRPSKSKPNLEMNINTKKRISFLNNDKYSLFNNNSKRFEKSTDFIDSHFFFDKINNINSNKNSDLFKSKSKRNWNPLNLFGINNKTRINDENDLKIMPVNNIKSLF